MCKSLHLEGEGKKKINLESSWWWGKWPGNLGVKEPVPVSPRLFFVFFSGRLVDSTLKLFSFSLFTVVWTGSWQSAPYVWTIHNPREELHNRSHPRLSGEQGDYAVSPIPVGVWRRKAMPDAVRLAANPPHPAPPLSPRPSGTCTVTEGRDGPWRGGRCRRTLQSQAVVRVDL